MSRTTTVDVHYPGNAGRIELHTEDAWETALPADRVSDDGSCASFELAVAGPSLAFKPVLARDGEKLWAQGENRLVTARGGAVAVYPHFGPEAAWTVGPLAEDGPGCRVRTFLPPGYAENTLRRYPSVYLHEGRSLLGLEAELGPEVFGLLGPFEPAVFVDLTPADRETAFTRPGYQAHADYLVNELVPKVEAQLRVSPEHTAVMGAGLGGVAAFYLAWEWPGVFELAACSSSPFGLRDNLFERVATESRRETRLYLDSGWPGEAHAATGRMVALLRSRGYTGDDLCSFVFPEGRAGVRPSARALLALQFLLSRPEPTRS